jgi:hypothetical protein
MLVAFQDIEGVVFAVRSNNRKTPSFKDLFTFDNRATPKNLKRERRDQGEKRATMLSPTSLFRRARWGEIST